MNYSKTKFNAPKLMGMILVVSLLFQAMVFATPVLAHYVNSSFSYISREKVSEEIIFIEGEAVRFRTFVYEDGSVVIFAALVEETTQGFAAFSQNLYETDIFSKAFVDAVNVHADNLLSANIEKEEVIQPRNPFVVTNSGFHRQSETSHRYPGMHIQFEFDWFTSWGPFAVEATISNGTLRAWNHTTGVLGMQFDQSITRAGISTSFTFGWPSFTQSGTTNNFRYQNVTETGFFMARHFRGTVRGTWAEVSILPSTNLFSITSMATQAVSLVPGHSVEIVDVELGPNIIRQSGLIR